MQFILLNKENYLDSMHTCTIELIILQLIPIVTWTQIAAISVSTVRISTAWIRLNITLIYVYKELKHARDRKKIVRKNKKAYAD